MVVKLELRPPTCQLLALLLGKAPQIAVIATASRVCQFCFEQLAFELPELCLIVVSSLLKVFKFLVLERDLLPKLRDQVRRLSIYLLGRLVIQILLQRVLH